MNSDHLVDALRQDHAMEPALYVPNLPSSGVAVMRWRRTDSGPSGMIRHPDQAYTLSIILQPMSARAWADNAVVWSGPISANTMRLTPPSASPQWISEGAFDYLHLSIPASAVDRIAGEDAEFVHRQLRERAPMYTRDPTIAQLGNMLLNATNSSRRFAIPFVDGLVHAMVAHLLERYATQTESAASSAILSSASLKQVISHIRGNLDLPLRVAELARIAKVSESHFAHAFRSSVGVSPHRYVISERICEAKAQLGRTDKSILQVALATGFKDASHFTRTFRAEVGQAPLSYRRQFRGQLAD